MTELPERLAREFAGELDDESVAVIKTMAQKIVVNESLKPAQKQKEIIKLCQAQASQSMGRELDEALTGVKKMTDIADEAVRSDIEKNSSQPYSKSGRTDWRGAWFNDRRARRCVDI